MQQSTMVIELANLHEALEADQLIPHFQPLVELKTGKIQGFEVLTRWQHPVHGAFLPSNLIELAEANGLIGIVAQTVFSKAFAAIASVPSQLRLSVNLSPIQLRYRTLASQFERMSAETNFPLNRLTVEITESALLKQLPRSQAIARELKDLGCRLSLDDFGTGYSSLTHLQALPFDEIKIDRSFVKNMTKKRESRKIVAATIGLGHSLGLSTIAEGIETEEQADMLRWLGADIGQGWHFGRPMSFQASCLLIAKPPQPFPPELASPGEDWAVSSLEAFPTQRLAQLRAIYDGAPVGLCFLDCHLRYISVNQKLADLNGSSVAKHLGKTVEEMVPKLFANIEPYLLRARSGEAIAGVEVVRPSMDSATPDGWLLCSYQPAFDEADEVIGISISVLDITEQKQAKDALHESELVQQHMGALHQRKPWIMDAEGHNLQISSDWVLALPGSRERIRNLGWLEALHLDDLKSTIRKMKKALRTGEPIDMEYRVQDTEGEWRWMRSRGSPRFGPNGEITRWYGSVEDIHEDKCALLQAQRTQLKMRSMLKGVPVAILVGESGRTVISLSNTLAGDLPNASSASTVPPSKVLPQKRRPATAGLSAAAKLAVPAPVHTSHSTQRT
jgi:PAS domain S-box-containing protein